MFGLWVDLAWGKAVPLAKGFHEINNNTQHCIVTQPDLKSFFESESFGEIEVREIRS